MPGIPEMVAAVVVVTEFLKATLRKVGIDVTQPIKVIMAVIGSIGVVVYFAVQTGTPFSLDLVWTLAQLIAAAVFGYKVAMKFKPTNNR